MDANIPPDIMKVYRSSIPEKLASLKEQVAKLQSHAGKQELEALRFAVHKLAGSSGTYGFIEVSRLCRNVELKLDEMIQQFGKTPVDTMWIGTLDQFLQQIERGFNGSGK